MGRSECIAQLFAIQFVLKRRRDNFQLLLVGELRYLFASLLLALRLRRKLLKLMIICLKIHSFATFRVNWAWRCKLIFHFLNRIIVMVGASASMGEVSLLGYGCK